MTLEEKKIALINYTEANPYTLRPWALSRKFRLSHDIVYQLCCELKLQALGFEKKNKKYYLQFYIRNHPELTALQISRNTECKLTMVYEVAQRIGHRFETKYTQRSVHLIN